MWQSMEQPDKVANPARGQLKQGKNNKFFFFSARSLLRIPSCGARFGRPVPRQPAQLRLYMMLAHGISWLPLSAMGYVQSTSNSK